MSHESTNSSSNPNPIVAYLSDTDLADLFAFKNTETELANIKDSGASTLFDDNVTSEQKIKYCNQLKNIKCSEIKLGEITHSQGTQFEILPLILEDETIVPFSGRSLGLLELRGNKLKEVLEAAKASPEATNLSVHDYLVQHINDLRNSTKLAYFINSCTHELSMRWDDLPLQIKSDLKQYLANFRAELKTKIISLLETSQSEKEFKSKFKNFIQTDPLISNMVQFVGIVNKTFLASKDQEKQNDIAKKLGDVLKINHSPQPGKTLMEYFVNTESCVTVNINLLEVNAAVKETLLPDNPDYMKMVSLYFGCEDVEGQYTLKTPLEYKDTLLDELTRGKSFYINGQSVFELFEVKDQNGHKSFDRKKANEKLNEIFAKTDPEVIVYTLLAATQTKIDSKNGGKEGIKRSSNLTYLPIATINKNATLLNSDGMVNFQVEKNGDVFLSSTIGLKDEQSVLNGDFSQPTAVKITTFKMAKQENKTAATCHESKIICVIDNKKVLVRAIPLAVRGGSVEVPFDPNQKNQVGALLDTAEKYRGYGIHVMVIEENNKLPTVEELQSKGKKPPILIKQKIAQDVNTQKSKVDMTSLYYVFGKLENGKFEITALDSEKIRTNLRQTGAKLEDGQLLAISEEPKEYSFLHSEILLKGAHIHQETNKNILEAQVSAKLLADQKLTSFDHLIIDKFVKPQLARKILSGNTLTSNENLVVENLTAPYFTNDPKKGTEFAIGNLKQADAATQILGMYAFSRHEKWKNNWGTKLLEKTKPVYSYHKQPLENKPLHSALQIELAAVASKEKQPVPVAQKIMADILNEPSIFGVIFNSETFQLNKVAKDILRSTPLHLINTLIEQNPNDAQKIVEVVLDIPEKEWKARLEREPNFVANQEFKAAISQIQTKETPGRWSRLFRLSASSLYKNAFYSSNDVKWEERAPLSKTSSSQFVGIMEGLGTAATTTTPNTLALTTQDVQVEKTEIETNLNDNPNQKNTHPNYSSPVFG